MAGELAGRRVVVTGTSGGIGGAIARLFCAEGALVHGLDRSPAAPRAACDAPRGDLRAHAVDLRDAAATARVVDDVVAELGGVDVLVNVAAILPFRFLDETDDATLDDVMAVNFVAVYRLCRRLYPAMRARRSGAIVNVASELALVGLPGYSAYCASKGAVLAFTRALALEAAPHGVRVNALCPGPTDTLMMAAELAAAPSPDEARAAMLASVPLGRLAHPEEIARAALFLASERTSFVQGATVVVDGGRTAA
ncbi:MAG: SDR family oxidoreductase [Thermodesulfobacteriota bacterium]